MTRSAILARFRETWVDGALPMVVEHRSDTVETLCASPSLWMGGRAFAEDFDRAGLRSGRALSFDLPLSIRFVQGLVGALRTGPAIDLRPVHAARRSALTPDGLTLLADSDPIAAQTAWIGPDGSRLSRDELDESVGTAIEDLELSEGLRVQVGLAGRTAHATATTLLAPLWARCELHLLMDPTAHRTPVFEDAPPQLALGS